MKKIIIICFILLLAVPAMAEDFNCQFPPYGKTVEQLNDKALFSKHLENGGITYYKFNGECTLQIEKMVSPVEQYYGFIDNKVYCNLISFYLPETLSIEEFEEFGLSLVEEYIVKPLKRYEEGDWRITTYKYALDGLVLKFKFNRKTRQGKVGWYYKPLKSKDDFLASNE